MPNLPKTRQSLLLRLRDSEHDAWTEFSDVYRPAIYRLIRRRGWQDADAQDLTQLILVKIAKAIEGFDPNGRARFRTWLTTICRNTLVDELRRRHSQVPLENRCGDLDLAAPDISEAELASEHRRQVFRRAAKLAAAEFTSTTWEAFWETAVLGKSTKEAARLTGISVGAVYTARSRVMQRLKQLVQEYDDAEM